MPNVLKLIDSFPRGRTTGALLRIANVDLPPSPGDGLNLKRLAQRTLMRHSTPRRPGSARIPLLSQKSTLRTRLWKGLIQRRSSAILGAILLL